MDLIEQKISSVEKLYGIFIPDDLVDIYRSQEKGLVSEKFTHNVLYLAKLEPERFFLGGEWDFQFCSLRELLGNNDEYNDEVWIEDLDVDLNKIFIFGGCDSGGQEYVCLDFSDSIREPKVLLVDFFSMDVDIVCNRFEDFLKK